MESVWSVSKLSTESVGSRRELVVNCELCSHRRRRQFRRVGVAVCIGHYVKERNERTNA